jgi:phage N-6-adenine-methyltransferase
LPRPRIYQNNAEKQAAYRQRKRRRQPVYYWHRSDVWETPPELFAELHKEFHFTVDVAALPDNAKCAQFFSPGQDGLKQTWIGVCWMNPPYGPHLRAWVRKARDSARAGATVVCLLPARTDSVWWHDYVLPCAEVRFVRGRLKFNGSGNSAPFPSAVVVFRPPVLLSPDGRHPG